MIEEEDLIKKIIIKIVILIIFVCIFTLCYILFDNTSVNAANSLSYLGKNQQYYDSDNNIYENINYFFNLLEKKEYNKAYEMLSDECKENIFSNNVDIFIKNIKQIINSDICTKVIRYNTFEETKVKKKKSYSINCTIYFDKMNEKYKGNIETEQMHKFFAVKNITVIIVENAPFDYKLELNIDSEG